MGKDDLPARIYLDNGYELIVCHMEAPQNWERVVRGVLTLKKLRSFWGILGHYLKEVKQLGLTADA